MEFGLLGSLAVWADGSEVHLDGGRQRALLAILLTRPNELVPTARLVEELWGEQPPATSVKAVHGYVSRLRKALGEGVLETRPPGYTLCLEPGTLDVQRFEALLDQGKRMLAEGAAEDAARVLRKALAVWRGSPYADFRYEPFARNEIARLEELRLFALEQRLQADLAIGHSAEVVAELEALVREHPLRESLCGLLILALYRAGRQASALAAYQDARVRLVDELGLDPSEALQQLEKAILLHDPSLDIADVMTPTTSANVTPQPAGPTTACVTCGDTNARNATYCHACGAPLTADVSVEARKTVTVLLCDVIAETKLGELLDPESLRLVISRFFERAAAVLERYGGSVQKFVGEEIVAVFGLPAVREDDALRAVRAALALRHDLAALEAELGPEMRLQIRIGVETGEVVTGSPTTGHVPFTGGPVAVGKRLEEAAAPGEILFGERTHVLLAHAVEATLLEPLTDRRRELTSYRLESVDADATALPRRDDMPMIGREPELKRLRGLYTQVASGAGARLVTIVGEAGIGKSRLARELLTELAAEATVLVGRCPPYGEGITFRPLRELFGQAGRGEDVLVRSTNEVFAAARRVFEELAAESPVVTVFDDVHWAEPTFLELIDFLTARLGKARVLLLCLGRPQLADKRPNWFEEPLAALSLGPLSETDSDRLLEALGAPIAARSRIVEAAEGNPLFVEQLAANADEQGGTGDMPGSIRGVLHERLDRLDRGQRSVLERAAVIGRSFSLAAVLDLTPQDERNRVQRRLLALARKRLVQPDTTTPDEGFRFHHALVRDAAYDGLAKASRADLHERVAARLEALAAEDALVGYHLEQAFRFRQELGRLDVGLGVRAGRLLRAAGSQAFGRSDAPATVSLLERARELLPDDDAVHPRLLIELSDARLEAGDIAGAASDLDDAIEVARRLGDRAAELHALIQQQYVGSIFASGASPEENVRFAVEAMPELERLGDELALERAWFLKGYGDYVVSRWPESTEALEEALRHARRGHARPGVVNTDLGYLAVTLVYGPMPVPAVIARIEAELRLAAGPDRALRAYLSQTLAGLLAMQGRLDDARRIYAGAVATYEELDLRIRLATRGLVGAQIELQAGDTAAAEQELRSCAEMCDAFGVRGFAAVLRARLADLLCTRGCLAEAQALARELSESAPPDELFAQVLWRCALARVHARRDEFEDAERLAGEALRLTESVECPDLRVAALTAAAELEVTRGRSPEAGQLLEEARSIMEAKGNLVALRSLEAAVARLSSPGGTGAGGPTPDPGELRRVLS